MKHVFFAIVALVVLSVPAEARKLVIYNFAEPTYEGVFDAIGQKMGAEIELVKESPTIMLSNLRDPNYPDYPDLVVHHDALNFADFAKMDLFAPIHSAQVEASVPAQFRDLEKGWVGLSYHARTFAVSPAAPGIDSLKNYEDFADPKWKGQICLRKATYTYTRGLIASMILGLGAGRAEAVLAGWVANNVLPIFVGDLYVMQAIEAGDCVAGLVNTDFFARYKETYPESPLALRWANQENRGVHVNATGMALLKHSKQSALALEFLENFAASEEAIVSFADFKKEYPANPAFKARSGIVEQFGAFRSDSFSMREISERDEDAKAMAKRVGYNP